MVLDVTGIKVYLRDQLRSLYNWTVDLLSSSTYDNLFTAIARLAHKQTYYTEAVFIENTWTLARNRKSLVNAGVFIDYVPFRKKGALGTLFVAPTESFDSPTPVLYLGPDIIFNKWRQFSDEGGEKLIYSREDKVLKNNTVFKHIFLTDQNTLVQYREDLLALLVPGHGIPIGHYITFRNTRNYDGSFLVHPLTDANLVVFEATLIPENFAGAILSVGFLPLECKQGTVKEFFYTAQGFISERITLFSDSIEEEDIEVWITDSNRVPQYPVKILSQSEIFTTFDLENYSCSLINSSDFTQLTLKFGDGKRLRKLTAGEFVLVRYVETLGETGNIIGTQEITQSLEPILDSNGVEPELGFRTYFGITGGRNEETTEEIREAGPRLFFGGYRAADDLDWEALINQHPKVLKSIVWTDYTTNKFSVSPSQSIVYVSAVSKTGGPLSAAAKNEVIAYLNTKKSTTDVVSFQPLSIINLRIVCKAVIKNSPQSLVKTEIEDALINKYDITKMLFSQSVYDSNVACVIDSLDNVLYHKTEVFHLEKSTVFAGLVPNTSGYVVQTSVLSSQSSDVNKQNYIQRGIVEVYLKRKIGGVWYPDKKVGSSDPNDFYIILGQNGYTISGGTVDYSNNSVSFTIDNIMPGGMLPSDEPDFDSNPYGNSHLAYGVINPTEDTALGYVLKLAYKMENTDTLVDYKNDVRLPEFYQIIDIEREDIVCSLDYSTL